MNELNQETQQTTEVEVNGTLSRENIISKIDINENIRSILNVPNKNNLYKDLNLNPTYLNLKNFISGRESELKKKSVDYLSQKLNILPINLYIDLDDIDEEDIENLKKIQDKFLKKLSNYTQKFSFDKKRIKGKPITDQDIKNVEDIMNEAAISLDLSELSEFGI